MKGDGSVYPILGIWPCRDSVTDVFLDALAEAALQQLQHFSARQLATLAYNYGTLNHWGRNDQELLDAITIRMLHQHHVPPPPPFPHLPLRGPFQVRKECTR